MSWREVLELFARYLWPVLLAWNIHVYSLVQTNREEHQGFRLYVAQTYIAKADLEKMLGGFEKRFDKRFDQLFELINK